MTTFRPAIELYLWQHPDTARVADECYGNPYGWGYEAATLDIAAGLDPMTDDELDQLWHPDYTEGYLDRYADADADAYAKYRDKCEAEHLEAHTFAMWKVHGRPTGPLRRWGPAMTTTRVAIPLECYGCGERGSYDTFGIPTKCPQCGSLEVHLPRVGRLVHGTEFRDLPIGARFTFAGAGLVGVFVRVSGRRYQDVASGQVRTIMSGAAKVVAQ